MGPARARPLPHRSPGRRARGPAPRAGAAGRAARPRPGPRAAAARDGHPQPRRSPRARRNPSDELWARAAADYDRTVAVGARARLESTVGLLRDLAVTGGARGRSRASRGGRRRGRGTRRPGADRAGDRRLRRARRSGPASTTRTQAARIVAAAERTLTALGPDAHAAARARLLATIALESRGTRARRGREAAREAEAIARRLDDPTLLAFALNAVFMQRFERAGLAAGARRDRRGAGRPLGAARPRQLRGARAPDPPAGELRPRRPRRRRPPRGGGRRARGAPRAARSWPRLHRVLRRTQGRHRGRRTARPPPGSTARACPACEEGLLALALLCVRLREGEKLRDDDFGPHEPWARPLVHASQVEAGGPRGAAQARRPAARPPARGAVVPDRPRGAHRLATTARSNAHARRSSPPRPRSRRGVASSRWAQWRSSSSGAGS